MVRRKGLGCFREYCSFINAAWWKNRQVHLRIHSFKNLIRLNQAMPVDGIFLQLHGAMMAHGYDDCEGDLLRHIRELVGEEIPIGIELDPHCHISQG